MACSVWERRRPASKMDWTMAGPIDQKYVGEVNQVEASALRKPELALSVSEGNHAALVTPICALAAATRRSAAAMSGRRSSSSEGGAGGGGGAGLRASRGCRRAAARARAARAARR